MDPHNCGIFEHIQSLELQFSDIARLTKADLHTLESFLYILCRRSYISHNLFPNLEQLTFGHIHNQEIFLAPDFDYDLHQMMLWNTITNNIPADCQVIVFITDMLSHYSPALHETHLLIDEHLHDTDSNEMCCLIDWSPIREWVGVETLIIQLEVVPSELWSAVSSLPNLICLDISSTHVPDYILSPFPALQELKAGPILNKSFSQFIPAFVLGRLKSLCISIDDRTQEDAVPDLMHQLPKHAIQQLRYLCASACELEALTLRGWHYDALEILPLISPILPQLRVSLRLIGFCVRPPVTQALRYMLPIGAEFDVS
ncbi:hypothetical protein FRC11_003169 [Ceratobasidium sp. 423]|nr:hypothetical protein FRC11_003169 [Ceratobasidium sp. 423]